jgi:hypothetical protein
MGGSGSLPGSRGAVAVSRRLRAWRSQILKPTPQKYRARLQEKLSFQPPTKWLPRSNGLAFVVQFAL